MTEEEATEKLDVRGMNCPVPVLKTKQAFGDIPDGGTLAVLSTDAGSESDLQSWANRTADAELLEQMETEMDGETVYRHLIKKG